MSKPRPALWKKSPECWMLSNTPPPPPFTPNLTNPIWIETGSEATWTPDLYPGTAILSGFPAQAVTGENIFGIATWWCQAGVTDSAAYLDAAHIREWTTPTTGRMQVRIIPFQFATTNVGLITIVGPTGLVLTLAINLGGKLQLYTGNNAAPHWVDTALGSAGSATLALHRQYRVCLFWNVTSSTVWSVTWWVNDDTADPSTVQLPDGTTSSGTLATNSTSNQIAMGCTSYVNFAGTAELSLGQIIIDTEPTAKDMGDVRVTTKLAAAAAFGAFTTPIGAAAGPHADTYSARPCNLANGWSRNAAGMAFEASVCQDSATGDENITAATKLGAMTYIIAQLDNLESDANIEYDSAQRTAIIGTGKEVVFQAYTLSDWDADARLAGMSSSGLTNLAALYVAGNCVAYTP